MFAFPAVALALAVPRGAYMLVWVVLLGALVWGVVALLKARTVWAVEPAAPLAALPLLVLLLPLLPGAFMGDGAKSVGMEAGLWALLLIAALPAVDGLLVRGREAKALP
ncbi:MAG: hypothetical protein ACYC4R_02300 [Anaerolineae bacterium]